MVEVPGGTHLLETVMTDGSVASGPALTGTIVGRDREVGQIVELLDRDHVRVLSLVGPGGVGKTRLAQEVVHLVRGDFAHGAVIVSLAPVRSPDLVPTAVAQVLGVVESGDVLLESSLASWMQPRHLLLVLDNMEHVVDAAYPWLANLIATCPRLKVLATSRRALDITGEQRFRVLPLPVPGDIDTDRLAENAAVTLFTQRAREVRNDFAPDDDTLRAIASICARVDGLPLAIELAAARINAFMPADILVQLTESFASLMGSRRDAPPRLRSLRDAIAWSYDLLPPDAQDLLCQLAVFVGDVSLEAVNAVGADAPSPSATRAVTDLIAALVDHSLVECIVGAAHARFRMLETVREFATARLAEGDGLESARDRHAAWYQHLTGAAEVGLRGPDQAAWLDLLDVEHGNVREAMDWLTSSGRVADAIEMYGHIEVFLLNHGHLTEVRRLLAVWSVHPDVGHGTRARAQLITGSAGLAHFLELPESPIPAWLEALEIFRQLGDHRQVMRLLDMISFVSAFSGDRQRAEAAHAEYMALAAEYGDVRDEAVGLDFLTVIALQDGDLPRARACTEAALAAARKAGDLCMIAYLSNGLGELLLSLDGDIDRARSLVQEAHALHERLGDKRNLPFDHLSLAAIERTSGNLDAARSHLVSALTFFQDIGLTGAEASAHAELARIALIEQDSGLALQEVRQATAGHRQSRSVPEAAIDLDIMAAIALTTGDPHSAARFLGGADGLRCQCPPMPATFEPGEPLRDLSDRVRTAMDAETFERHHAAGSAWSLDEAATMALAWEPVLATPGETRAPADAQGLSPRELEVLCLLAAGLSNKEIAGELALSLRTVTTHITGILGKLHLSSRTQAVAYAIRNGLA